MANMQERTFIMVKPDGVHRGLVGECIKRFEQRGLKVVGMKMMLPSKELLSKHYSDHVGKGFFNGLVEYMSSGPVVPMVLEGAQAVDVGRRILGATKPVESAPGTIRGDFCLCVGRNMVHGSDSVENAKKEIALWFAPHELMDYQKVDKDWVLSEN